MEDYRLRKRAKLLEITLTDSVYVYVVRHYGAMWDKNKHSLEERNIDFSVLRCNQ
jgi:hypothetical protein